VALDIPYKTHLRMLRDAFDKAPTRGVNGMKVRGGRALVAANLSKGYELWPEPEFIERTAAAHDAACKRAGIPGVGHLITFYNNDSVVTISNHALLGAPARSRPDRPVAVGTRPAATGARPGGAPCTTASGRRKCAPQS